MLNKKLTDEEVEEEILRLQQSHYVRLGRKEEAIRNKRRQYMYTLRMYEKKGRQLEAEGITLDVLNEMGSEMEEFENE
jgi:hypothetical protein